MKAQMRWKLMNYLLSWVDTQRNKLVQAVSPTGEATLPSQERWAALSIAGMVVTLVFVLLWSIVARIDVIVPARGKLEPMSSSQPVQSRRGGVVTAIQVQEGEMVERGELLVQLDKTELQNQLQALLQQRDPLQKTVAVLRAARQGNAINPAQLGQLQITPELFNRVQNRQLLVAQLSGDPAGLTPVQRQRFELFTQQLRDQQALLELTTQSLAAQNVGIQSSINETQTRLQVQQDQVGRLSTLAKEGAIPRVDFIDRVTDLNGTQNELNQSRVQQAQLKVQQSQAVVNGRRAIAESLRAVQAELTQLDNEVDRTIEQSEQQLVELNAQIRQAQLDLDAQDLRAPVSGRVFGLQVSQPGVVAQAGQALVNVTPDEDLIAKAQISNKDIAGLNIGDPVKVRVDAYPFTEFGEITGRITNIASDAVPVDGQNPTGQSVFPVEVRLDRPFLEQNGRRFPLVPGMSLSIQVITGNRAPIMFVLEPIIKTADDLKATN
ncbi:HlyD family type I secretion periplasmic adaptor subunit [Cyanobacteria bacterium FACHB-502]|nr:HlyD family type I secretion periplasmic adaptor subunit [Cyanobacteria bacterium FACHB-502]